MKLIKLLIVIDLGNTAAGCVNACNLRTRRSFQLIGIYTSPPETPKKIHHCVYPHCAYSNAPFLYREPHSILSVQEEQREYFEFSKQWKMRPYANGIWYDERTRLGGCKRWRITWASHWIQSFCSRIKTGDMMIIKFNIWNAKNQLVTKLM